MPSVDMSSQIIFSSKTARLAPIRIGTFGMRTVIPLAGMSCLMANEVFFEGEANVLNFTRGCVAFVRLKVVFFVAIHIMPL